MEEKDTGFIRIKCCADALSEAALLSYWNPESVYHRTAFQIAVKHLRATLDARAEKEAS